MNGATAVEESATRRLSASRISRIGSSHHFLLCSKKYTKSFQSGTCASFRASAFRSSAAVGAAGTGGVDGAGGVGADGCGAGVGAGAGGVVAALSVRFIFTRVTRRQERWK